MPRSTITSASASSASPSEAGRPPRSRNVVVVDGVVHGDVVTSVTQRGESISSFDVAVTDAEGRTLVPVSVRGDAPDLVVGQGVAVRGRVAKRFHRAGSATVARTSVEAFEVLVDPRPAAVRRLAERALRDAGLGGPARASGRG